MDQIPTKLVEMSRREACSRLDAMSEQDELPAQFKEYWDKFLENGCG